jgi:glucan phosphoethanolaminetransferase (alkaline phosphatase superfamily)
MPVSNKINEVEFGSLFKKKDDLQASAPSKHFILYHLLGSHTGSIKSE